MSKRVHIAINPKTGQVEFEVEGVTGSGCTDITQALVKGHLVQDERLTEDFYTPSELPQYTEEG